MATSTVQVRVDDDLKAKATAIYDELGMDLSTAVRLFLKRSVMVNGVPFSMILPKDSLVSQNAVGALFESSRLSEENRVSDMSLEEINAEIDEVRAKR